MQRSISFRRALIAASALAVLASGNGLAQETNAAHGAHKEHACTGDCAGMHKMQRTGDQDYDFASMMRHHHQMGVKMAQQQLANGKDPEMRKMAQKIVDEQQKEIARLDAWLAKHPPKTTPKTDASTQ